MSLSTVTRDPVTQDTVTQDTAIQGEAARTQRTSPRRIGIFALILVAGLALGYGVANIEFTSNESDVVTIGRLSHGDFLRLNTTDLEWLAPLAPEVTAAANRPTVEVDSFIYANVGSYAPLLESWETAHTVDPGFLEVNTIALEFPTHYSEQPSGPR